MVNSCRETPGPIPNPEAKPAHADGTATGRLWESKSPPTPNNTNTTKYNKEEDGIPPSGYATECVSVRVGATQVKGVKPGRL